MPEQRPPARRAAGIGAEAAGLLSAPAVAHFALRLQLMAAPRAPDPTIHSGFVFDPAGLFSRYASGSGSDVAIREGVRVGFIVPARICYLLFGTVAGFAVLRYLLALVAIVPVYVLFLRLAGRSAAAFASVLVLLSPVFVASLGTDYPNSACLAYLTAGTACLFMPSAPGRRPVWVGLAAAAFTMAAWSLDVTLVLAGAAAVVYAVPRLRSQPRQLALELGLSVLVAVSVSACLSLGSELVLGRWDYFLPTFRSSRVLAGSTERARWHSTSLQWLPYLDYLLVLPVVACAFLIARGRRVVRLSDRQTAMGVTLLLQVAGFAYLEFGFRGWMLEDHYFSSLLWPAAYLTLAVVAVDLAPRVFADRRVSWLPAVTVVALELGYEALGTTWRFVWGPTGLALAAAAVVVIALAKGVQPLVRAVSAAGMAASALGLTTLLAISLVLTVATPIRREHIKGVVTYPLADYGAVLGQGDAVLIDRYRISAMVPSFVGPPQYAGEKLMTWWPGANASKLYPVIGVYHGDLNAFGERSYPLLSPQARRTLERERPGEVLIVDLSGSQFAEADDSLRPFAPKVLRTGVLRSGSVSFAVRLVELQAFTRNHRA